MILAQATETQQQPVPEWLIERYGRERAVAFFRSMLSRWNLVTYNCDPGHYFQTQVDFLKEVLYGEAMEVWWVAGNRGGKTEGGAVPVVSLATGILPFVVGGTGFEDRVKRVPPVDIWVVSLDFPASRDIIRPKLERYIPKELLDGEFRVKDFQYRFLNGSTIGLKSADSGRDKFQGVSRKLIWPDEEMPEDIYDECLARVIDQSGKIVCTMTPLNGISWSYDRIWTEAGMEPDPDSRMPGSELLIWRQTKNFDKLRVFHSRTEDNPYLPKKAVGRVAAQWKDKTIRNVRLGGLYTLIKGSHVFPVERVQELMEATKDPIYEDRTMGLRVFEEADPGISYKIGIDAGKGKEKGDFSVAIVYDPLNSRVVAKLRARIDAVNFALRVYELGHRYNTAEVVVERQDHGIVVITELQRLHYPRIWRKKTYGKVLAVLGAEYGFNTDVTGKALIVNAVHTAIENQSVEIPDREIVDEFSWFIHYDDKLPEGKDRHKMVGRCGAMRGKHDDCVIALGLALVGASQVSGKREVPETVAEFSPASKYLFDRTTRRQFGPPAIVQDSKFGFRLRRMGGRGR